MNQPRYILSLDDATAKKLGLPSTWTFTADLQLNPQRRGETDSSYEERIRSTVITPKICDHVKRFSTHDEPICHGPSVGEMISHIKLKLQARHDEPS